MNWLDLLLILIIAVSVAASFAKGFAKETISLVAAIAALLCGAWFYRIPAAMLRPHIGSRPVANLFGFLLIFAAVIVLGLIVTWVIGALMKVTGLSWLDRLLGAAFGLARGVIVSIAIVTAILAFAPGADAKTPPKAVVQSKIAPYIIDSAHVVTMAAPRELRDEFARRYTQVKRIWEDAWKQRDRRAPAAEI